LRLDENHIGVWRRPELYPILPRAGRNREARNRTIQLDIMRPECCRNTDVSVYRDIRCRYWELKGSPYSITERRVPELIPVLGRQPAVEVSHKPGGRLPLLSARPAVTPATLKRAATNVAAW